MALESIRKNSIGHLAAKTTVHPRENKHVLLRLKPTNEKEARASHPDRSEESLRRMNLATNRMALVLHRKMHGSHL
jgi:hypothetical protein